MKFQRKLEQTKYGITRRERKATTSTRHLVASTPTSGNLPCQRGRLLPTTKRYLRTNYRNRSRQIRRIPSPTFPLLLLYKTKDVGRKQKLIIDKIWLHGSFIPVCSSCYPRVPSIPPLHNSFPRFYPPFLSSLPFCLLSIPLRSDANDGNLEIKR